MISVKFACGHVMGISENPATAPTCQCGEHRVQSVKARAPRFTGAVTGPYAEFKNLDPITVDLTTSGPLKLKAQD